MHQKENLPLRKVNQIERVPNVNKTMRGVEFVNLSQCYIVPKRKFTLKRK
jgi:hypothetical protein